MAAAPEQPTRRGPVLFDDLYEGPRWRYGLPSRHAVRYVGSPAGPWILYSERPSDDPCFPFGTIDFPHEGPVDLARVLDLVPLGRVKR
jgi:hypothetical protein